MTFDMRPAARLLALIVGAGLVALGAGPGRADAARIAVGTYVPGGVADPAAIDEFGRQVGRQPLVVVSYKDWTDSPFDPAELTAVWNRGAVSLVTWEPWSFSDPGRRFPLREIANGRYDDYLRGSARAAKAWGLPILLRFAHEMNGSWYPWGRAVDGNTAADYRDAWRHVVEVFRQEGAGNVRWVWTPYVTNGGRLPFGRFYPGDRWVDWAGLDGFNWGATRGKWQSFIDIFSSSYRTLVRITRRPLIVAETGSVELGGDKARWLRRALGHALPKLDHIRAVVWWDDVHPSGADWRVDTSEAALASLRSGLSHSRYRTGRKQLLATPPRLPR